MTLRCTMYSGSQYARIFNLSCRSEAIAGFGSAQSVANCGDELEAVLLVSERGVVEVVVADVKVQAEAVVYRHGEADRSGCRIGVKVVPSLVVCTAQIKTDVVRQGAPVALVEVGTDEIPLGR